MFTGLEFAKVILSISYSEMGCVRGCIKSVSTFAPTQLKDFAGVHRVHEEFVLHGEFQTRQDWSDTAIEVRCARMLSGFHNWCREVARVNLISCQCSALDKSKEALPPG